MAIPYVKEAGVIFCFYATGVLIFTYLAAYQITETQYFIGEEGVVVPIHVVHQHEHEFDDAKGQGASVDVEQQNTIVEEKRG